ncbi:MAG: hypothetical protein ACLT9P_07845 [Evtepia gabavorous]
MVIAYNGRRRTRRNIMGVISPGGSRSDPVLVDKYLPGHARWRVD